MSLVVHDDHMSHVDVTYDVPPGSRGSALLISGGTILPNPNVDASVTLRRLMTAHVPGPLCLSRLATFASNRTASATLLAVDLVDLVDLVDHLHSTLFLVRL